MLEPKDQNIGVRVYYSSPVDSTNRNNRFGIVKDFTSLGGQVYAHLDLENTNYRTYPNVRYLTIDDSEKEPINSGKFSKEELLEIIDQDKPAEQILMDLKDHLTN